MNLNIHYEEDLIMNLTNKKYNFLKWVALVLLPAIVVFVFAITKIWGLPYGPEIAGTVSAIDVLLGALLQISTKSYNT